jgi:hypothetical protein
MATYTALTDLIAPLANGGTNVYVTAGDLINDTGVGAGWLVQSGFVPQNAVPLDADAVSKYFAVGPRPSYFRVEDNGRWSNIDAVRRPSVYWYQQAGTSLWYLRGHEALGSWTT